MQHWNDRRLIAVERHKHDGHAHTHSGDKAHYHYEEVPSPGNEPAVYNACSVDLCDTTAENTGQPCSDCYRELGVGG